MLEEPTEPNLLCKRIVTDRVVTDLSEIFIELRCLDPRSFLAVTEACSFPFKSLVSKSTTTKSSVNEAVSHRI